MATTAELWSELERRSNELDQLAFVSGAVAWDQQTYLPSGAGEARGEHQALLSRLSHERLGDPRLGECLNQLEARAGELSEAQQAGVRNLKREHLRETVLHPDLVERLARLEVKGFEAWIAARQARDFSVLEPVLAEIVGAIREKAEAFAAHSGLSPYAALVDVHDPGVTPEHLTALFAQLRAGLAPLLDGIRGAAQVKRLPGPHPEARQLGLARAVAGALGFNLAQGRVDLAAHPFTVALGATDVRITTRLDENDLLDMLGSTIHETGHALYEQGLPRKQAGVSRAASTGAHESQSRFWENIIGRSWAFLGWLRGPLAEAFGDAPSHEVLYRAANRVEPGFIRVAADEVTYNLHVGLRFELEQQLFAERDPLPVRALPEAWNAAVQRDLGLDVTDPVDGVLQDVHWPSGAFGYFPSYTLGNLYASALGATLREQVTDLDDHVAAGHFTPIIGWLRENIHAHGAVHEAPQLFERACPGRDLVADLLDHFWARHGALYGLTRTPS